MPYHGAFLASLTDETINIVFNRIHIILVYKRIHSVKFIPLTFIINVPYLITHFLNFILINLFFEIKISHFEVLCNCDNCVYSRFYVHCSKKLICRLFTIEKIESYMKHSLLIKGDFRASIKLPVAKDIRAYIYLMFENCQHEY